MVAFGWRNAGRTSPLRPKDSFTVRSPRLLALQRG
jgi:hypothetical protein